MSGKDIGAIPASRRRTPHHPSCQHFSTFLTCSLKSMFNLCLSHDIFAQWNTTKYPAHKTNTCIPKHTYRYLYILWIDFKILQLIYFSQSLIRICFIIATVKIILPVQWVGSERSGSFPCLFSFLTCFHEVVFLITKLNNSQNYAVFNIELNQDNGNPEKNTHPSKLEAN